MDTEVIRQFLVSIGVQTDEKGLKRFGQTVDTITKQVTEFAEKTAAAAAAVSAAVVKISSDFEDLYYASQRLRSSGDNIKAFSFGVSQMGGDAKAARSSLESFASFMRSNPMGEGFVRGLGVETRNATGGLREYADVLRDVGAQLRRMPYWAARQRANLLGIDENTLQALLRGTDLWSDRYRKLVAGSGVNMDQMAADATNLMQSFRLLRAEIEIYFYKAISKIDPKLLRLSILIGGVAGSLALVTALLGPEIAAVLALAAAIALLTDDFLGWREGSDSFVNWSEWSDEIDRVIASMGDLWTALKDLGDALGPVGTWFAGAFGPAVSFIISTVVDLITAIAAIIRVVVDLLRGDWSKAWHDTMSGAAKEMESLMDTWRRAKSLWNALWGHPDSPTATGPSARAHAAAASGAPTAANQNTPAQRNAAQDAVAYFMRQGWTAAQAAGIVANLQAESGLNPHGTPGDGGRAVGVAQWHADRQRDFAAWAGHGIDQSTLAEQLAFVNYELTRGRYSAAGDALKRTGTAGQAGAVVSSRYERPRDAAGEMARRGRAAETILAGQRLVGDGGSRTVTIHSKTDIKVSGGDAKEAGKAVGAAVGRANSDLVRNTKTAVR